MSDQAPAVFQGSKYFGGHASGSQTTSSWGAWGEYPCPPQAAQPNHQIPNQNAFQESQHWNGFKPSYNGASLQQVASAYQGSFMEEYSPKDSELEWFHMEDQEEPQTKENAGMLGTASDAPFDGQKDLDGPVTRESSFLEDANMETGDAWLDEEVNDADIEAVQEQTSGGVEQTTVTSHNNIANTSSLFNGPSVHDTQFAANTSSLFNGPNVHDKQFTAALPTANFFESVLPHSNPSSAASLFGSPELLPQQQHNTTQFSVGNNPSSTEVTTCAPLETKKTSPDHGQAAAFFNREPAVQKSAVLQPQFEERMDDSERTSAGNVQSVEPLTQTAEGGLTSSQELPSYPPQSSAVSDYLRSSAPPASSELLPATKKDNVVQCLVENSVKSADTLHQMAAPGPMGTTGPVLTAHGKPPSSTLSPNSASPVLFTPNPTIGTAFSDQPTKEMKTQADISNDFSASSQLTSDFSASTNPPSDCYVSAQPANDSSVSKQPTNYFYVSSQPVTDFSASTQPVTDYNYASEQPAQATNDSSVSKQPTNDFYVSSQPVIDSCATEQPTNDSSVNTEPTIDSSGSSQAVIDYYASEQSTNNFFASTQPTIDSFASTQPTNDSSASSQPVIDYYASEQPTNNSYASTQPSNDCCASAQPTNDSSMSTQPPNEYYASTVQTLDSYASAQPALDSYASAQPANDLYASIQPTKDVSMQSVEDIQFVDTLVETASTTEPQSFTPQPVPVPNHPQLLGVSAPSQPSQQSKMLPSPVGERMEDSTGFDGASFQKPVKPSLAAPNKSADNNQSVEPQPAEGVASLIQDLVNVHPQSIPISKHPPSATTVEPSSSIPALQQTAMLPPRVEQGKAGSVKKLESSTLPEEVTGFVINSSLAAQDLMSSTGPALSDVHNSPGHLAEKSQNIEPEAVSPEEVDSSRQGDSMMQHRALRALQKEHAPSSPCTTLWTSVPTTMPAMMLVAPVPSSQKNERLNSSALPVDQDTLTDGSHRNDPNIKAIRNEDGMKLSEQQKLAPVTRVRPQNASSDVNIDRNKQRSGKENKRTNNEINSEIVIRSDSRDLRKPEGYNFKNVTSNAGREYNNPNAEHPPNFHTNDKYQASSNSNNDTDNPHSNSVGNNPARDLPSVSFTGNKRDDLQSRQKFGNPKDDIPSNSNFDMSSNPGNDSHSIRKGGCLEDEDDLPLRRNYGNPRDDNSSNPEKDHHKSPNYGNSKGDVSYRSSSGNIRDDQRANPGIDHNSSRKYDNPDLSNGKYGNPRDDLHSRGNYGNPVKAGDGGNHDKAFFGGNYRETRNESRDYPPEDRVNQRNESIDRELDAYPNQEYRHYRRHSEEYSLRNENYHRDEERSSKPLKDHNRQDASYNDAYAESRQSRDFPERRERDYNRYRNDYEIGNIQKHRQRRDNHYDDDYRDTRHWQDHAERRDDRYMNDRGESRDRYDRRADHSEYRYDREFLDRREMSGDYAKKYRDSMDHSYHQERRFDPSDHERQFERYGDDYRTSGRRSRETFGNYSRDVDHRNESYRDSEYSSRWEDHQRSWDDEDERYRRNSQYSQGYSDRHTPVHSGRSTPTGYYDYASPQYGGTYGYNYQWDNYWSQYHHYAQYYPGYPGGYGYYYPDYTDYSGYASSQDQSYISGQDQYPGSDSQRTDWPEQQELEQQPAPEPVRLTPVPFSRPHVSVNFGAGGLLVIVHANHPEDGQKASLDISHVTAMFSEQEQALMKNFPGPLSRHDTVRKDVIRYTSEMADTAIADHSLPVEQKQAISVMWKFLGLLCKQNGMFSMADIAELLVMQHREFKRQSDAACVASSIPDQRSATHDISHVKETTLDDGVQTPTGDVEGELPSNNNEISPMSAETKLTVFREMLITGSRKEALEFAMKEEMWGHALTLASKMDSRTFGNIVARFQSSFSALDPLQTVYLHLGGRQPVALTNSDEWMLHLAAMISNASQFPDSDRRNITILGDTLANRGLLYAAHLCYLLAGWPIGNTADPETKVALIGANHKLSRDPAKLFKFANFQMTEVFEYALTLKTEEFSMPAFQLYKFLYATKLSEAGLYGKAMHYLETIATKILLHPGQQNTVLVRQVYEMADRLQGFDEIARQSGDEGVNFEWIEMLNKHLQAKNSASIVLSQGSLEETATTEGEVDPLAQSSASYFSGYDPASVSTAQEPPPPPLPLAPASAESLAPETTPEVLTSEGSSFQLESSWTLDYQPSYQSDGAGSVEASVNNEAGEISPYDRGSTSFQDDFDSFHRHANPGLFKGLAVDEGPRFTQQATPLFPPRPEDNEPPKVPQPEEPMQTKNEGPDKKDSKPTKNEKAANGNQKSWFSGLFSKIIPKASNEMKLPDDNKKTIYYDKDKGRWINTEEDETDKTPLAPPPTDFQLMGGAPSAPATPMQEPVQGNPAPFTGASQPFATPSHSQFVPGFQTEGQSSTSSAPGPSRKLPQVPAAPVPLGSMTGGSIPSGGCAEGEGPPPPPSKFSRKAQGLGRAGARSKYVDVLNPGGQKKSVEPAPPSLLPILPTATTTLPGNFFVPQPVPGAEADDVSAPQIANPSSRPASVGSEDGLHGNIAPNQRSRSSSQSSGSLSQTSAEVRSYFNHTQDQSEPPNPFQGPSDQQYTQQHYHHHQQLQQQQQQHSYPAGQSQLVNSYNQLKLTSTTQQRGQTQQQQPPLQNPEQHFETQNTEEIAQPAPPVTAPLLFNPASFQGQSISHSTARRGRYGRTR